MDHVTSDAVGDPMERRIAGLEYQLREQTVLLDRAVARLDALGSDAIDVAPPVSESEAAPTRRALLRSGALALGAGIAGAAALASPAAAADGDPVNIGQVNTGTSRTNLQLGGSGALGHNVFTAQDSSFDTSSAPAAVGGYATGSRVGNGVYGYTSGNVATHTFSGYALVGACDSRGTSSRAHLFMNPTGAVPTSESISHRAGEIVVSSDRRLWFCTVDGTPGTWEEITGDRALIAAAQAEADAAQTAADAAQSAADAAQVDVDALDAKVDAISSGPTFLPTSQRAFDSRPGLLGDGGPKGAFAAGENRVIDLTVDTDVPAGARAAIIHLTLAGSLSAAGYLAVYSAAQADLAPPSFSSLNWAAAGQFDANTTVSAISPAGALKVFALNPAHVAIDVIGYYA